MIHIRLANLSETDLDQVVEGAGGKRINQNSGAQTEKNADYLLDGATIELKLLEQEPLEGRKTVERRSHVAELMRPTQPGYPVVVVDPSLLGDPERTRYYDLLGRRVQKDVKDASKQIASTRKQLGLTGPRILFALNVGLTSFDHAEFREVISRSARKDTGGIDGVVVGGVYHHSDTFDAWVFWPLEYVAVNLTIPFPSFDKLRTGWNALADQVMTDVIRGAPGRKFEKMPVLDVSFEDGDETFVKPAPQTGTPSDFWVHGRPRNNSTGISVCPAVGTVFPDLTKDTWVALRTANPHDSFLKETYEDYRELRETALSSGTTEKPVVPIPISRDDTGGRTESDLIRQVATAKFDRMCRELILKVVSVAENRVLPNRYVLVETREVGQDLAFDTSSITLVDTMRQVHDPIVQHLRIFYEHAVALAAAYAVKNSVDVVVANRNDRYKWS